MKRLDKKGLYLTTSGEIIHIKLVKDYGVLIVDNEHAEKGLSLYDEGFWEFYPEMELSKDAEFICNF